MNLQFDKTWQRVSGGRCYVGWISWRGESLCTLRRTQSDRWFKRERGGCTSTHIVALFPLSDNALMQCGLILYGREEVSSEQESFCCASSDQMVWRTSFDWPPFQRKELLITAQSFVHLGLFWYLWCFWCLEYFEFRSCCFRGRLLNVHLFKEKKNSIERTLNCSKFCWWPVVGWRGGMVFQIIISNFSFLAVNCKNCYWQPELQGGLP